MKVHQNNGRKRKIIKAKGDVAELKGKKIVKKNALRNSKNLSTLKSAKKQIRKSRIVTEEQ